MATVSDHKTLDCPLCFKRYISPRVLPCQHILCEKCLAAHITSQVGSGKGCFCPLCNSPITPPDPKLTVDKWAKAFPLHSLICSLLEATEVYNNGENICEPCKSAGETTKAEVWCTNCREYMCHSCDQSHRRYKKFKLHRRCKQFKQHSSISISEIKQELQSNIHFDQNCDHHCSKETELFCVDHRKICCSVCIATDHRQCNDLRSINDSKVLGDIEGAMKSLDTVQVSTKPCTSTNAALQSTDGIIRKANSRTNISTDMCAAQVQKRDLMTSQVTFIKAVTKQILGERAFIIGGTYCSDGRILMADYMNNRLLQLDVDYNVVNQYKIDGYPSDIAVGNNDNEIYIAINQQYIYKCTLDTGLTIVSRIEAPKCTWGITVSGNNIIVGTHTAVVILTQNGSVVQSIPRSGYVNSYVAKSQSQQTICHTDNHDVVCRTLNGKELFRYKHEQLRSPFGICVDRHDNLYTCGYNSHNVHQVSLDKHSGRIIVDNLHRISQPFSVMFHPQKDELVVTSRSEHMVFEVYRLS